MRDSLQDFVDEVMTEIHKPSGVKMTDPATEIEAMRAEREEMRKALETFWEALPERLRQEEENKVMREVISEVSKILHSIELNDIFEDTMRNHAVLALAKLQSFLP